LTVTDTGAETDAVGDQNCSAASCIRPGVAVDRDGVAVRTGAVSTQAISTPGTTDGTFGVAETVMDPLPLFRKSRLAIPAPDRP
jgi:hypothetical protein